MATNRHRDQFRQRRVIAAIAGFYAVLIQFVFFAGLPFASSAQEFSPRGVLCAADGAIDLPAHPDGAPGERSAHFGHCLFCGAQFAPATPDSRPVLSVPYAPVAAVFLPVAQTDRRPGDGGAGRPQIPRGPPAFL
jgi:hypothetical protein